MKKFLFLLILLPLISCEKTVTEYIDSASWKIDERVQTFSQYITNINIVDNTLIFHSPWNRGYLDIYGVDGEFWSNSPEFDNESKVHINDLYSIGLSENQDAIIVYLNELREQALTYYNGIYYSSKIKPSFFDSTFTNDAKILTTFLDNDCLETNGQNQVLFFFSDYSNVNMNNLAYYYCIMDFSHHNDPDSFYENTIEIDNVIVNEIPGLNISISDIYYANQQYYCSLNGADIYNFIITQNGEILEIPLQYLIDRFFEYDDKLWCKSGSNLYNSNEGLNWIDSEYTVSPYLNFFEFEERLCGFRNYTLYELDLENVEVYYLDISGLDYHYITSIDFSLDKVYLSTIGGMYSKNVNEFFENKSTEVQRCSQVEFKRRN